MEREIMKEKLKKYARIIDMAVMIMRDIAMLLMLIFVYKKIISLAGVIWIVTVVNGIFLFVPEKYRFGIKKETTEFGDAVLVICFLASMQR